MPPKRKRTRGEAAATDDHHDDDGAASPSASDAKKKEAKAERKKRAEESRLKARRWAEERKKRAAAASAASKSASTGVTKSKASTASSVKKKAATTATTGMTTVTSSRGRRGKVRTSTRRPTRKKKEAYATSSSEDEEEDVEEEKEEDLQPKPKRQRTTRAPTRETSASVNVSENVPASSPVRQIPTRSNYDIPTPTPKPQPPHQPQPQPQQPHVKQPPQQAVFSTAPFQASVPMQTQVQTHTTVSNPFVNAHAPSSASLSSNQILLSPTDPNVVYVPVQVNANAPPGTVHAPAPVPTPVVPTPVPAPAPAPAPTAPVMQKREPVCTPFVSAPVSAPVPAFQTHIMQQQQPSSTSSSTTTSLFPKKEEPRVVKVQHQLPQQETMSMSIPSKNISVPMNTTPILPVEVDEEEDDNDNDNEQVEEQEEKIQVESSSSSAFSSHPTCTKSYYSSKTKQMFILIRSLFLCIMIGVIAYIVLSLLLSDYDGSGNNNGIPSMITNMKKTSSSSSSQQQQQQQQQTHSPPPPASLCYNNRGFGGINEEMDVMEPCNDEDIIASCPEHGRCEGGKLIDCSYKTEGESRSSSSSTTTRDAIATRHGNDLGPFYVPSNDGSQCVISPKAMEAMLHLHSFLVDVTLEYECRSYIGLGSTCRYCLSRNDIYAGKMLGVVGGGDTDSEEDGDGDDDDDDSNRSSVLFSLDAVAEMTNLTPHVIGMLVGKIEKSDMIIVDNPRSVADADVDTSGDGDADVDANANANANADTTDATYLIGLSERYIIHQLPTPIPCWIRGLLWEMSKCISGLLYVYLGVLVGLIWSIASANPLPTLLIVSLTYVGTWIRSKRLNIQKLRKETVRIQNMAHDKLILDCNEGEGYAALHLRDEIVHELYPEPCAERKRFMMQVWPRVVVSIRADNRITKSRKVIRGKSLEWFEWVAESSRNSRRSGVGVGVAGGGVGVQNGKREKME